MVATLPVLAGNRVCFHHLTVVQAEVEGLMEAQSRKISDEMESGGRYGREEDA